MVWYYDLWRVVQWITLVSFLCFFTRGLISRFGFWVTTVFWFQLGHAAHLLYFGYPLEPKFHFQLSVTAGEALLWMLSAALLILSLKPKHFSGIRLALICFALSNALVMGGTQLFLHKMYGVVPSAAANSALLACLVPFVISHPTWRYRIHATLFLIAMIFWAGGSTGMIALGIAALFYLGHPLKHWKEILSTGVLFALLFWFLVPHTDQLDFFSSRGRTEQWILILKHFLDGSWFQVFLGHGPGSFEWLHPLYQFRNTTPTQYFLWAHNEGIQVLFENGILGASALFFAALKLLELDLSPPVRASLGAYTVVMLTQAPLRLAPFQILGALILGLVCVPKRSPLV